MSHPPANRPGRETDAAPGPPGRRRRPRRGYSLIEAMVVTVIIGVLSTVAVPRLTRSLEQAKADVAAANLRAIWTAERIYWLDNRTYTSDLTTFVDNAGAPQYNGLLDRSIVYPAGNAPYAYQVPPGAGATFSATATRQPGGGWAGTLTIAQDGSFTPDSVLTCPGQDNIVISIP